jgi:putative spermidine/putrescine transport system substrate-binding protein
MHPIGRIRRASQKGKADRRLAGRRLLAGACVAAAACALALTGFDPGSTSDASASTTASGLPNLHGVTLSYLGFGGTTDSAMKTAWFGPFDKATGMNVVMSSPTDYTKIDLEVKSGSVDYDLVDGDAYIIDGECGTIWDKLNVKIPSSLAAKYRPGSACSVPEYVYGYIIEYSKQAFPTGGPQNCQDFFNTKKFPGKRAIWSYEISGVIECAAIAAGANPQNPYPHLNINAAFAKLNSIKKDLVIYNTVSQAADGIESRDFSMGIVPTETAYNASIHGAKIAAAQGWAVLAHGAFGVPKGAPHKAAAEAFLQWEIQPKNNEALDNLNPSNGSLYGPSTSPAFAKIRQFAPWVTPLSKVAMVMNSKWWTAHSVAVGNLWNNFITG